MPTDEVLDREDPNPLGLGAGIAVLLLAATGAMRPPLRLA